MKKSNILMSILVTLMVIGIATSVISGISYLASTYMSINALKNTFIISLVLASILFLVILFVPYNTEENEQNNSNN